MDNDNNLDDHNANVYVCVTIISSTNNCQSIRRRFNDSNSVNMLFPNTCCAEQETKVHNTR